MAIGWIVYKNQRQSGVVCVTFVNDFGTWVNVQVRGEMNLIRLLMEKPSVCAIFANK